MVGASDDFVDGAATAWALDSAGTVEVASTAGISRSGNHLGRWGPVTPYRPAGRTLPPLVALAGMGDSQDAAVYGLDAAGAVYAWGADDHGELATPPSDTGSVDSPVVVPLPGPAAAVFAAPQVGYAVLRSGELWAWGRNDARQLGAPSPAGVPDWQPRRVDGVPAFRQVVGTSQSTVAMTSDGTVWTWGAGVPFPLRPTVAAPSTGHAVRLAVGWRDVWALWSDGTVRSVTPTYVSGSLAQGVASGVDIAPGGVATWGPRVLLRDGTVAQIDEFGAHRIPGLRKVVALGGVDRMQITVVGS